MTETTFGSYAAPAPRYSGTRTSSVYIPMHDGVQLLEFFNLVPTF